MLRNDAMRRRFPPRVAVPAPSKNEEPPVSETEDQDQEPPEDTNLEEEGETPAVADELRQRLDEIPENEIFGAIDYLSSRAPSLADQKGDAEDDSEPDEEPEGEPEEDFGSAEELED
jgi:hypothetical protein